MTWEQFNMDAAVIQESLEVGAAEAGKKAPPKDAGVMLLYLYLKKRGELPAGNRAVA